MPSKPGRRTGGGGNGGAPGDAPLARIQELYKYMVERKLETLEYEQSGLHIRLVRQRTAPVQIPVAVPVGGALAGAGPAAAFQTAAAPAAPALPAGAAAIKAPMMGIFYRASTPSSPPFVKTGDPVKKGQVLGLIEAMKVFNEIKADYDCTVLNILLENGKPVKAAQDLFVVQKT